MRIQITFGNDFFIAKEPNSSYTIYQYSEGGGEPVETKWREDCIDDDGCIHDGVILQGQISEEIHTGQIFTFDVNEQDRLTFLNDIWKKIIDKIVDEELSLFCTIYDNHEEDQVKECLYDAPEEQKNIVMKHLKIHFV